MLVLTRRAGQKIIINDTICIELLKISGGQASIGIEAPEEVTVYREEVYERIIAQDSDQHPH